MKQNLEKPSQSQEKLRMIIQNSNRTLRRTQDLVKTRDLAEHYLKLFKSRESEPATSSHNSLIKASSLKLEESEREMAILKENKSPGGNGVQSELLKRADVHSIITCRKSSVTFGMVLPPPPRALTDAIVAHICKRKGPKSTAENHQSIFPLNTIGKLYASFCVLI